MTQSQTIMSGGNAAFLDALYEDYLADPSSVDPQWRAFFDAQRGGVQEARHSAIQQAFYELGRRPQLRAQAATSAGAAGSDSEAAAAALVEAYRTYGHLRAGFDPLKLHRTPDVPELDPAGYGVSLGGQYQGRALKDVVADLETVYCGPIGYEFSYLPAEERRWFAGRLESGRPKLPRADKLRLLDRLTAAEGLEKYLHIRYAGQKRFSLEGSESYIPLMDRLLTRAGNEFGVREVVIGMAHRGRLNTLINLLGKPSQDLFDEFEGKKKLSTDPNVSGDVKYHMGYSADLNLPGGPLHLVLAYNPSHLEIVAPVVQGSVRARQDHRAPGVSTQDVPRSDVLPITVHGDAAVIGQGVVAETLNLADLRGFTTGGTVRIVINNQVGFTVSDTRDSRSSRYCTDVAKIAGAPAMHVNGDDPEAVAYAADVALEYRQKFGKDVFIDLISFRRHGHNEADDPTMTQPVMYQAVKAHPGTLALYAQQLEQEGVLAAGEAQAQADAYRARLDAGERVVDNLLLDAAPSQLQLDWQQYSNPQWQDPQTGVGSAKLGELAEKITAFPEGFQMHRGVARVMEARRSMGRGEQPVDWGMGEMLAYASLLDEGFNVRLVGEDSGRGTFVHRHAVVHDQRSEGVQAEGDNDYLSLAHLGAGQGRVEVIDSTLSEEAVMGFEYGYAGAAPRTLVLWEAQFGDFANGAQIVIDQFIAAAESKWLRLNGLTLLLPHGYEGAGPEHSSARLERYLQLCAQNNMQVVVPSSAAQIFHLLRRQMHREYRRPLVVMTPKSLLRNKLATSPMSELTQGMFRNVIGDDTVSGARRVVISSGKLHWELFETRSGNAEGYAGTALVRLEQLYPFPQDELVAELRRHPGAQVVWAQEEPENQGAWLMIREDLEKALAAADAGQTLSRVTRPRMASTAAGYASVHAVEQAAVVAAALGEPLSREQVAEQMDVAAEAKNQG